MGMVSATTWVAGPMGATVRAITSCPACSYLVNGTCEICSNEDPHPGCIDCVDGRPAPAPWYAHPLILGVGSAVVVALAVSLVVPRLERAITQR